MYNGVTIWKQINTCRQIQNHLDITSQYFKASLKYEGRVLSMDNKNVPRQSLEQIVRYATTGKINIDPTNVCDWYLACDYCCINEITEKCQKYFVHNMNIYNLENLITMACTTSNY